MQSWIADILAKVFFGLLLWKCGGFLRIKESGQHSFLVYVGLAHSVPVALHYTSVGHVAFIWFGFYHNLHSNKRKQPHTFLFLMRHSGLVGTTKLIYHEKINRYCSCLWSIHAWWLLNSQPIYAQLQLKPNTSGPESKQLQSRRLRRGWIFGHPHPRYRRLLTQSSSRHGCQRDV